MKSLTLTAMALVIFTLGNAQSLAQNAYITNTTSNNVSVIDTATNKVTATIPVGDFPDGVAVSPDGRRAYITNTGSGTVSVIDTATNKVIATIATSAQSVGIAVSPDGRRVYTANLLDQSISVIDTETNALIATVPVSIFPYDVKVAGKKIYVTNCTAQCSSSSPGTATALDAATYKVIATIPVAPTTNAPQLAVSPDGRKIYVTNEISDNVPVIDTATDTVTATIPLGNSTAAAVSPDGQKIYIPNRDNNVAVVDAATNTVITTTGFIGGGLLGVSVTPDGRKVFVANYAANTVTVIDTATDAVAATIPVGVQPFAFGVFIQPALRFAGRPGKANCYGQSVSALVRQYRGLNAAASALGFASVKALQDAIEDYCEVWEP
jgi:YVTN family beta-propeller protein